MTGDNTRDAVEVVAEALAAHATRAARQDPGDGRVHYPAEWREEAEVAVAALAGRLLPEDTRTEWGWSLPEGGPVDVRDEEQARGLVARNPGSSAFTRWVGPWVPVPERARGGVLKPGGRIFVGEGCAPGTYDAGVPVPTPPRDEHADEQAASWFYPERRPTWLGIDQSWPCGRCGVEVDAARKHRCVPAAGLSEEKSYRAASIAPDGRRPCGECGPGYWIGDEGCQHAASAGPFGGGFGEGDSPPDVPNRSGPVCNDCANRAVRDGWIIAPLPEVSR